MSHQSDIAAATRSLHCALDKVQRDLAEYPTPVSGCDQQFTYLIATKSRIRRALDALGQEVFVATPRTLAPGLGVESR